MGGATCNQRWVELAGAGTIVLALESPTSKSIVSAEAGGVKKTVVKLDKKL
jgi:hypothetical protein